MNVSDLEHFRDLLMEREQNLQYFLQSMSDVDGDDEAKARGLLTEIKDALSRIDDHTYGKCKVCDGEVEQYRLEVQPVTEVCLSCISKKEQALLEEELLIASKIHRALLPQTIARIDGFDVAVRSYAARNVGGDYYDFLEPNNGGPVRVVIADSMGSGLPAGLLMSNLQGALRVLAEDVLSPAPLVARLNQWLVRNVPVTKFVSLTCLSLENTSASETTMVHTNAGHCPTILIRNDDSCHLLESNGGVLGVHPGFEYEEDRLTLSSGDLLLLFTDGVSEAANADEEMFGEDQLVRLVREHRTKPINSLVEDIVERVLIFTEQEKLGDDLTIIALRKQ